MAFFDYALAQMIESSNLLVKIESIVDWQSISDMLDKKLGKRDISIAGKIPYNLLSMFKVLLIQQWHTLSDPKKLKIAKKIIMMITLAIQVIPYP